MAVAATVPDDDWPLKAISFLGVALIFASLCGALVASRRPDNAVGRILLAIALSLSGGLFATQYANRALVDDPGSLPGGLAAAWFQSWLWTPLTGLFPLLVLLFPTATLPSRRWRPVLWAIFAATVLPAMSIATRPPAPAGAKHSGPALQPGPVRCSANHRGVLGTSARGDGYRQADRRAEKGRPADDAAHGRLPVAADTMTAASFRRAAALTAIVALACLGANGVTWLAAAGWDLSVAAEPSRFATATDHIGLLRTSLALDVCAYVLLVPLIVALWASYDDVHPARSRMYAAGGLAYALVGATGAVVLFAAWPPLMRALAATSAPTDQLTIAVVFDAFTEVVYRGMWNVVGAAGLGVWLLGMGTLMRPARPRLGWLGMAAGIVALADAALVLAGARSAAKIALAMLGVLGPLWIILVAIGLLSAEAVTNIGRSPATGGERGGAGIGPREVKA